MKGGGGKGRGKGRGDMGENFVKKEVLKVVLYKEKILFFSFHCVHHAGK